jgi:mRNA interferase RelE/StbE
LPYQIDFDPQAVADLKSKRAFDRAAVIDAIDRFLSVSPTQVGQSRIKRLRDIDSPQYCLRVGEFRVFYDVIDESVYILRILAKADVDEYLKEMGYET